MCALLLAFDGYDIVAIGFAIPSLSAAWHVRFSKGLELAEHIAANATRSLFSSL